ncbi:MULTISPECIES: hypothetical protein [Amycolatopsis]|uniref:LppX_LprAFG lipoprotein n=1 Tax=Amycolatopsis dongchuanensis TaxID=1070866 RepID=A0ABP8VJ20_9PSEU
MKRPMLAVGALALVLTLAGCGQRPVTGTANGDAAAAGNSPLFSNAQELVRAATSQTEKAKSAKFSMDMDVAGQTMTAEGAGTFDGDNTTMQMSMTVGGMDQELRYVGNTLYIRLPEQLRARVPGGKPWGKVPADSDTAKALGAAQAQQNDPSKTLQQIQEAGTITRSEQTTLDGKPVTHYWIDIDFAKAMDRYRGTQMPLEQLEQIKDKVGKLPAELWLDRDQLPVQVFQDMSPMMVAAGAPASAQTLKMTMKYSDWGTPVDVQTPPADEVGELQLPN